LYVGLGGLVRAVGNSAYVRTKGVYPVAVCGVVLYANCIRYLFIRPSDLCLYNVADIRLDYDAIFSKYRYFLGEFDGHLNFIDF